VRREILQQLADGPLLPHDVAQGLQELGDARIAVAQDAQHDLVALVLDAEEEVLPGLQQELRLGRYLVAPDGEHERTVPGVLEHLAGQHAPVPQHGGELRANDGGGRTDDRSGRGGGEGFHDRGALLLSEVPRAT